MEQMKNPQPQPVNLSPDPLPGKSGLKLNWPLKITIFIVIFGIMLGAGFYLGRRFWQKNNPQKANSPLPATTASPSINPTPNLNTPSPLSSASISPTLPPKPAGKTLTYQYHQNQYQLIAPDDWQISQETDNYTMVVNITNTKGILMIRLNDATEGAPCGFPDAPLAPSEMFPDTSEFTYQNYHEFKGSQSQIYRRVNVTANPSAGMSFFAVCEKRDNDWFQPTGFGFISYSVPYSGNPEQDSGELLKIMDAIFTSFKVES